MGIFGKIGQFLGSKVLRPVAKTVANTVLKPVARIVGNIAEKPLGLAQKAIQTIGDVKQLPVVGGLIQKGLEAVRAGKVGGALQGVVKQLDKTDARLGKVRQVLDDPSKAISAAGKASGGGFGRAIGEIFQ
jgi:hypothetical protein